MMVSSDISLGPLRNSAEEPKVVVYTTNGCQKCSVLKEWLKTAKRHFEERSLEDVEVMTGLVMRNVVVLSAPVIEVNNSIYNENQIFEGDSLATNKLLNILDGNNNG